MFEHPCPAVSRAAVVGEEQSRLDPVSSRREVYGKPVGHGVRVGDHLWTGCLSRKDDFFISGDFTRRLTGGPEEKKES